MNKNIKMLIILFSITLLLSFLNQKSEEFQRKDIIEEVKNELVFKNDYIPNKKDNVKKIVLSKIYLKNISLNNKNNLEQDFTYDASIVSEKLKSYDYFNDGNKIVFLTFDDGPSIEITPRILDILDKNEIKATFFVLGKSLEKESSRNILKRIYKDGHAIGNHTYSHNYDYLYPSRVLNLNNFKEEIIKTNEIIKSILGNQFSTRLIRSPGGYGSWNGMNKLDVYLKDNNLISIDWNALTRDSEGPNKSSKDLINAAKETSKNKEMVVLLMHDIKGKESTIISLQEIIDYYKSEGFQFKILK